MISVINYEDSLMACPFSVCAMTTCSIHPFIHPFVRSSIHPSVYSLINSSILPSTHPVPWARWCPTTPVALGIIVRKLVHYASCSCGLHFLRRRWRQHRWHKWHCCYHGCACPGEASLADGGGHGGDKAPPPPLPADRAAYFCFSFFFFFCGCFGFSL